MATKTLPPRTGDYVRWEGDASYSRDTEIVDASGGALVAGTVLGRVTSGGALVAHTTAASDGSEDAVAILFAGVEAVEGPAVVTARLTEVDAASLTYHAGATGPNITAINAALKAQGILVR